MRSFPYGRIVIVGLGGAWRTARDVAFFVSYRAPHTLMLLVDGKVYQVRQRDHECFDALGNKAWVQVQYLQREFPGVMSHAIPFFVGSERGNGTVPVSDVIKSGDVVLLQVDNARSRRVVQDFVQTLRDITLISGGVNEDQLRVQTYLRRNGIDLTPPFTAYCHDIANPQDELPAAPCPGLFQTEPVSASDVLHPFTLLTASTFIVNAMYQVWEVDLGRRRDLAFDVWHDIARARTRAEVMAVPVTTRT